MLGDGVSAAVVFLVVSILRFEPEGGAQWSVGIHPGLFALAFAMTWIGVFWALGMYRLRVRWSMTAEARDIAKATLVAVAITLSLLFVLHQDNVSRLFLAILFVVQPTVTLASRALLRRWFDVLREGGRNKTYMLVAGTGSLAQTFADRVERHRGLGIKVVGHLTIPYSPNGRRVHAVIDEAHVTRPVLGSIDHMQAIFHDQIIDEVAVCLPQASSHYLEPIIAVAAEEGKTVRVPRDPEEGMLIGSLQEEFDGFLVRSVIHDGQRDLGLAVKRVVDVVLTSIGGILLSPIWIVAALLIWVREGQPILFRQTRVGRHGRTFTIFKFRTMVTDAEEQRAALENQNYVQGPAFKIKDDPRVTPLGRLLRRTSIDELPQLLNVLSGDMSLVGPRPALPREVEEYDIWHRRRLSMRPGITGLWQVERRLNSHFDERAELDLKYIDQWSMWIDFRILVRTLTAVLARTGQ
jgi:exopolysaccharide biosynthesis polyprenyl glycosylphosphotransferase